MKEVKLRGLSKADMISAQNEVAVLKKLKHPHVIAIEEALIVDDTLCIVMEWAEGKDLSALIAQRKQQNRPFTEDEVLKVLWQLTSALAYCHHGLHMLHRDLKPQNVFLAANGDVKLGDFGLAKVIEETCALARTQCGTPLYMSPELCEGREYDRGADVWALGCILYELMTLTAPWSDVRVGGPGGISALLKKIASSSLDLSSCKKRYSPELCGILASLVQKRGSSRPALDQVLQLEPLRRSAPKPPSNSERPLPPSWRKVPSASRPGAFSYLHVPTGYKQAFFPERDELPEEVIAALKMKTFAPGQQPPPTADARGTPGPTPPRPAPGGTPTPSRATPGPTPPRAAPGAGQRGLPPTPPAPVPVPTGAVGGGTPRVATPHKAGGEAPLPRTWRKVPSASRPGQFTYLHVPTGYKQVDVPTTDAPSPEMFAAWKAAKGNATHAIRSPATPAPATPPRVLTPHAQANGLDPAKYLSPHKAANPFDFRAPNHYQRLQQQQRLQHGQQGNHRRF